MGEFKHICFPHVGKLYIKLNIQVLLIFITSQLFYDNNRSKVDIIHRSQKRHAWVTGRRRSVFYQGTKHYGYVQNIHP